MVRYGLVTVLLVVAASHSGLAQNKSHGGRPAPAPKLIASKTVEAPLPPTIPSAETLEAISARGRALAERDSITWLGSGAMTSLSLPADSIRRLIVRRTDRSWEVAAGRLVDDGNTFLLQEVATPGIQKGRWASTSYDPPQATGDDYFARAARAIETSAAMFRPVALRLYIATVVPAPDGPWWFVYFYPAPTEEGVWPRGGDMRFTVSADGRVIVESRRLHETITEYSVRTARPASALLDREAAVSGDTPEDTDVFHVLQRRPAIPELMLAGKFRYRIDVDGTIRLLPNN